MWEPKIKYLKVVAEPVYLASGGCFILTNFGRSNPTDATKSMLINGQWVNIPCFRNEFTNFICKHISDHKSHAQTITITFSDSIQNNYGIDTMLNSDNYIINGNIVTIYKTEDASKEEYTKDFGNIVLYTNNPNLYITNIQIVDTNKEY